MARKKPISARWREIVEFLDSSWDAFPLPKQGKLGADWVEDVLYDEQPAYSPDEVLVVDEVCAGLTYFGTDGERDDIPASKIFEWWRKQRTHTPVHLSVPNEKLPELRAFLAAHKIKEEA